MSKVSFTRGAQLDGHEVWADDKLFFVLPANGQSYLVVAADDSGGVRSGVCILPGEDLTEAMGLISDDPISVRKTLLHLAIPPMTEEEALATLQKLDADIHWNPKSKSWCAGIPGVWSIEGKTFSELVDIHMAWQRRQL